MSNKARHAFGSRANISNAIAENKIDAYDILFLSGENESPTIGWLDSHGNPVIIEDKEQIVRVETLPTSNGDDGVIYVYNNECYVWDSATSTCVPVAKPADLTELENLIATKVDEDDVDAKINQMATETVNNANAYTDEKLEDVLSDYLVKKYEISYKPEGTLVSYRDKEIRVMCPTDTEWQLQNSGEGADPNRYYIGFKAYAPNTAMSFKEDLAKTISDTTMYYFENNDFAGIDENGRKYSIVWLPVAKYEDGVWTYYGTGSSEKKYIGWYYSVEWYDANGTLIVSDCIRINLSNEACYSSIEPYYVGDMMNEIETKIAEISSVDVVEF